MDYAEQIINWTVIHALYDKSIRPNFDRLRW